MSYCQLRAQSCSFRERLDDDRESTLKFRSTSQSEAACVKLKGTEPGAESKFEMDAGTGTPDARTVATMPF